MVIRAIGRIPSGVIGRAEVVLVVINNVDIVQFDPQRRFWFCNGWGQYLALELDQIAGAAIDDASLAVVIQYSWSSDG